MFLEALESRLKVIEEEILRLTKLAAQSGNTEEQENHLQREARELRLEIRNRSQPAETAAEGARLKKSLLAAI
jgi:glycine cleavage system regulatory protein